MTSSVVQIKGKETLYPTLLLQTSYYRLSRDTSRPTMEGREINMYRDQIDDLEQRMKQFQEKAKYDNHLKAGEIFVLERLLKETKNDNIYNACRSKYYEKRLEKVQRDNNVKSDEIDDLGQRVKALQRDLKSAEIDDLGQRLKAFQRDSDLKSAEIDDLWQRLNAVERDSALKSDEIDNLGQLLHEEKCDNDFKSQTIIDLLHRLKAIQNDYDVKWDELSAPAAETRSWWFRCGKGLLTAGLFVGVVVAGVGLARSRM